MTAGAEAAIASALAKYPGEEPLLARLGEIQTAVEERKQRSREQILREIAALEARVKSANSNRLREMKKTLQRISQQNAGEDEIQTRVATVREAIDDSGSRTSRAPKRRPRKLRRRLPRLPEPSRAQPSCKRLLSPRQRWSRREPPKTDGASRNRPSSCRRSAGTEPFRWRPPPRLFSP